MTKTLNVVPPRAGEGAAQILLALGEARIEVRSVSAQGQHFLLSVDAPAEKAEFVLRGIGYTVEQSAA